MTLNAEQIEQIRACLDDGSYTPLERKDFGALCDMALSSLRVQQGVMVSVPRELLQRVDEALQRALDDRAPRRIPVDMADADILQCEVRKLLAAAPSAQNAAPDELDEICTYYADGNLCLSCAPDGVCARSKPAGVAPSAEGVIEMPMENKPALWSSGFEFDRTSPQTLLFVAASDWMDKAYHAREYAKQLREYAVKLKAQYDTAPVATVIDNNQPGWKAIVETAPNVTLDVGAKLCLKSKEGGAG
jgi:hypothetical protein